MKFLHTGDLHIGKTVHDFSMLAEQRHVLSQIIDLAVEKDVDGVIIAGDVYDRSIPSTDAVNILDEFLTALISKGIKVIMISGNHDSPERVGFADKILEQQGLFIAGNIIDEKLKQVTFKDSYGEVTFVLLPFVKPALVGAGNSQEAMDLILAKNGYDSKSDREDDKKRDTNVNCVKPSKNKSRKVLVTHYFVTGSHGEVPELSDSETLVNVGGLEQVGVKSFAEFDYVALGHIHKPQRVGEGHCYYAGSPLKYSFSECQQIKSVNLVTFEEEISVEKIPLKPIHEMRKIKGRLNELIKPEVVDSASCEDYIQALLTDEEELIDPMGTLRSVYPNIMQIQLLKNEQKGDLSYEAGFDVKGKTTFELFSEFYELVKDMPLDETREQIVKECLERAGEEGEL